MEGKSPDLLRVSDLKFPWKKNCLNRVANHVLLLRLLQLYYSKKKGKDSRFSSTWSRPPRAFFDFALARDFFCPHYSPNYARGYSWVARVRFDRRAAFFQSLTYLYAALVFTSFTNFFFSTGVLLIVSLTCLLSLRLNLNFQQWIREFYQVIFAPGNSKPAKKY